MAAGGPPTEGGRTVVQRALTAADLDDDLLLELVRTRHAVLRGRARPRPQLGDEARDGRQPRVRAVGSTTCGLEIVEPAGVAHVHRPAHADAQARATHIDATAGRAPPRLHDVHVGGCMGGTASIAGTRSSVIASSGGPAVEAASPRSRHQPNQRLVLYGGSFRTKSMMITVAPK